MTNAKARWASVAGTDVNLSEIGSGSDNPRYEVLLYGFTLGSQSRQAEIDRLTWERNLYYFLMSNRGKTARDFYRNIENELWRQAVSA
jgi:hypothetical protein